MGVSLNITWPDGSDEEIHLGGLTSFEMNWATRARKLGLELIPILPRLGPVTPTNLDPLVAGFAIFRAEWVRMGPGYESGVEFVDHVIEALRRLKGKEGWRAYFG